ncbi:GGDEF domain-containing protein [Vibrio fluvialis]
MSNAFYSIYQHEKELITANTVEANQIYADKMAEITGVFFEVAKTQLEFSAKELSTVMDKQPLIDKEVDRLKYQTNTFDSVGVINNNGVITAISPESLDLKGDPLSTSDFLRILPKDRSWVSPPTVSLAGNYLVSISHTIVSSRGSALGYLVGTIYLEKDNLLSNLLKKHAYQNQSRLYVVDQNNTVIFHPDSTLIGTIIPRLDDALDQRTAIEFVTTTSDIPGTGWTIVIEKDKREMWVGVTSRIQQVAVKMLPLGLLTLLCIWLSAHYISKPLWSLAFNVNKVNQKGFSPDRQHIHAWYIEASLLQEAVNAGVGVMSGHIDRLQEESFTDPMTKLLNRRGLRHALQTYEQDKTPMSVLSIDVDYFKKINDEFGHEVGDQVLIALAKIMRNEARHGDILCRLGGEEFLLLLPNTPLAIAVLVAERLRNRVSSNTIWPVSKLTASIGISYCSSCSRTNINDAIKRSDMALYSAKSNGRNRIELYET